MDEWEEKHCPLLHLEVLDADVFSADDMIGIDPPFFQNYPVRFFLSSIKTKEKKFNFLYLHRHDTVGKDI